MFIGTDALCREQELYRAWSSSSWGLLFVHKLFCGSPVPPHCGVRQSSSCSEEASFVSTGQFLHTTSLVFKCLRANAPPASCWYFSWGIYSVFLYVSCIYVMCFQSKKNLIVRSWKEVGCRKAGVSEQNGRVWFIHSTHNGYFNKENGN